VWECINKRVLLGGRDKGNEEDGIQMDESDNEAEFR